VMAGEPLYIPMPEAMGVRLTGRLPEWVSAKDVILDMAYPVFEYPAKQKVNVALLIPPSKDNGDFPLEKGPNSKPLPLFEALPDKLEGPVLLKMGDNISTDEIMPAGAAVLPYRSNIPEISRFAFSRIDKGYYERAMACREVGSFVVGGENYGQGSSREHAALAPRFLGLQGVFARSFARIHAQNLVNFGILPLTFTDPRDWERIAQDDILVLDNLHADLARAGPVRLRNKTKDQVYQLAHALSARQLQVLLAGGLINFFRQRG
jgi:aconitase A